MADGARPVAGGSDLVVAARQGKTPLPASLVAIHGVSGLDGISVDAGALVLGALVSHADLEASADVRDRLDRHWRTAARSSARPRHATSEPSAATS